MPVVRAIYRGLKQVFETLFSGNGSSFRRVGLVEFPSPGMWSIVLISQAPSVEIANKLPGQEEHISVFLPCAPNPTTGFFFYVPRSKIIEVEMSAEDAATLIMSAAWCSPAPTSKRKLPHWPAWPTPPASRIHPSCSRRRRRWIEAFRPHPEERRLRRVSKDEPPHGSRRRKGASSP